ncbi:MAG: hypothetical protein CK424_07135 [Legionella sp.]|nr:MAG: hypothetical protein CK424_07135 [Legionella sp.]
MLDKDVVSTARETTLFEWTTQGGVDPLVIDRAKGVYFWDSNNKRNCSPLLSAAWLTGVNEIVTLH